MSKTKYLEPWMSAHGDDGDVLIYPKNESSMAIASTFQAHWSVKSMKARAERIVACVNAMEGIEDPIAARAILDDPRVAVMSEMLVALKQAYSDLQRYAPNSAGSTLARAIIPKAEGKS